MRADELDSANAGADNQSKPPAFQIIVLVSKTSERRGRIAIGQADG